MTVYIALLRAVNVGGTGKLPMATLKTICGELGFEKVETYIASGNVVFESRMAPAGVKNKLEKALADYAGKPVGVALRTAAELQAVLRANPFPKAEPKFTAVIFLDSNPPRDALKHATGIADEEIRLGEREIYAHYPSGMGRSKLKIPVAKSGTARNINTVTALAEMAAKR
jgi:uncharacterized protein (DUF1697 family)